MATILKFKPRGSQPVERDPDCAVCGTGKGVCAECLANAPMRLMVYRQCNACDNEWKQPAEEGSCPKCHSDDVVNVDVIPNGLKRL